MNFASITPFIAPVLTACGAGWAAWTAAKNKEQERFDALRARIGEETDKAFTRLADQNKTLIEERNSLREDNHELEAQLKAIYEKSLDKREKVATAILRSLPARDRAKFFVPSEFRESMAAPLEEASMVRTPAPMGHDLFQRTDPYAPPKIKLNLKD